MQILNLEQCASARSRRVERLEHLRASIAGCCYQISSEQMAIKLVMALSSGSKVDSQEVP